MTRFGEARVDDMEKERMHTRTPVITREIVRSRALVPACTLAIFVLQVPGSAQSRLAEQAVQSTFSSAGDASEALVEAVQHNDEKAVRMILDADGQLTSAGDEEVDRLERERFVQKYQEMHRLVKEPDGSVVGQFGRVPSGLGRDDSVLPVRFSM
jgi:hypothetical protein